MNIWGYLINPCKSYIILYYSHIGTILGLAIHSNHPGTSFDHLRAPDVMGLCGLHETMSHFFVNSKMVKNGCGDFTKTDFMVKSPCFCW